jgi:hypothetical protein
MNELIRKKMVIQRTNEMIRKKREEIIGEREKIQILNNNGKETKSNYLCSFKKE